MRLYSYFKERVDNLRVIDFPGLVKLMHRTIQMFHDELVGDMYRDPRVIDVTRYDAEYAFKVYSYHSIGAQTGRLVDDFEKYRRLNDILLGRLFAIKEHLRTTGFQREIQHMWGDIPPRYASHGPAPPVEEPPSYRRPQAERGDVPPIPRGAITPFVRR